MPKHKLISEMGLLNTLQAAEGVRLPGNHSTFNPDRPPKAAAGLELRVLDEGGDRGRDWNAAGEARAALSHHSVRDGAVVDKIVVETVLEAKLTPHFAPTQTIEREQLQVIVEEDFGQKQSTEQSPVVETLEQQQSLAQTRRRRRRGVGVGLGGRGRRRRGGTRRRGLISSAAQISRGRRRGKHRSNAELDRDELYKNRSSRKTDSQ